MQVDPAPPTDTDTDASRLWTDRTLSMDAVVASASLISLAIIGGAMAVHALAWQSSVRVLPRGVELVEGLAVGVFAFVVSLLIHELLHAFGFWIAVRDRKAIRFGINWSHFVPYAHCAVPMKASDYRFAVALPGIALGLMPLIVGLVANIGALTFYGAVMLAAAAGDMLILWCLRGVSSGALVRDHPTKAGCQVLT